ELSLATGEGQRVLGVRRHDLPRGQRLVRLLDVSGVRAAERELQAREPAALPSAFGSRRSDAGYAMTGFIGQSPRIGEVAAMVGRLRHTRSTVLVYGESGTGKELVARALHFD